MVGDGELQQLRQVGAFEGRDILADCRFKAPLKPEQFAQPVVDRPQQRVPPKRDLGVFARQREGRA